MDDWTPVARVYDPLKAGSIDGTDIYPHDRAVARAMVARYKPNKDVVGVPEHTVFASRLSPHTDEDTLHPLFKEFGDIKRLRLVRDIVTGFSRCYAFIEYSDERAAYRAQKHMDKAIVDEKEIFVDFECERVLKEWVPRRLGGGLGGQKESGQLRFGGKNRPFKKPIMVDPSSRPEGETFRDRLRAAEAGVSGERERYDNRHGRRNDRSSESRHRDRDRSNRRSQSQDRERTRDRHYRDRSRSRESDRRRR